jgi:hypothetical protein
MGETTGPFGYKPPLPNGLWCLPDLNARQRE